MFLKIFLFTVSQKTLSEFISMNVFLKGENLNLKDAEQRFNFIYSKKFNNFSALTKYISVKDLTFNEVH